MSVPSTPTGLDPVIAAANATSVDLGPDQTLVELIAEQAARTPAANAVITEEETLSYADLSRRADRLAARLRAAGVGPETIVGICAERSAAMVVGLLGVLKSGGAYLPLDPEYPTDRLSYMLADSAAGVVLTHGPTAERVRALGCRSAIDIDADHPEADPVKPGSGPDNLAYVIYTSGSTGRPKGACLEHNGVVNRLRWMQRAYPIGPADAVLQKTPFSFDVSVWEFFWPLMTGARLVMARPGGHRDAAYLAGVIREHDINVVHFVPSMLAQFLNEPSIAGLTSLRHVICSGEALPVDVAHRALALLPGTLENLYGPTEASVDVTAHRCRADEDAVGVPIGGPIANTQLHVLDEDFRPVAVGEVGELYLGGVQLARGYHGRAGLTAERFVPDQFGSGGRLYRTGDIARWRADGELDYLGRTDHQVKINGFRIELDEIAVALRAHPALRDAVVVPHTSAAGHQQLAAYIVPRSELDGGADPAELRDFLGRTLPTHMVPASFTPLAEIPLSPNGKIDRKSLPEPGRRTGAQIAPTTATERALAEVWRTVFGEVGIDDDFLDLGGDSIVALTLVTRARTAGLHLGTAHVLRLRTIRRLAAVATPASATPAVTTPIESEGRDAPAVARLLARPEVVDVHPLTPLQAGMLFHSLYEDGATDYFQQSVMRVTGPLDTEVFLAAWQDLVVRHAALRSRARWADLDRPVQIVEREVRVPVRIVDLSGQSEAAIDALLAEDRTVGFDPATAPLARLTLIRLTAESWIAVLSHHHMILDGWSISLIVSDLVRRYGERSCGEDRAMPAAPPFRRYVDWIDQQDRDRAADFWCRRLRGHTGGAAPMLGRPEAASDEVGEVVLTLSAAALDRVRVRARAAGLTLNSVAHGLWGLLLARYGDRRDVVFGSTFSGRPPELPEVDTTVGLFITTLPVRVTVDPEERLGEWLLEVQENLLELQDYQHCSLADIRAWTDTAAGQALFDTIVVGQNHPTPEAVDPATGLRIICKDTVTNTGYPLVMLVSEEDDRVEFALRYQRGRYERADVRRIADHLESALTAFATDPAQPLGDIGLVTAREWESWPVFGADIAEPVPEATIHGLVEATVRRVPEAVAVRCGERALTFAELNARANRLAHHLRAQGVSAETLVGVCVHRSVELMVSLLAVLKAGGAYVPLAPDNPPERLKTIIDDAGLAYVVADENYPGLAGVTELVRPDAGTVETDPDPAAGPDNLAYVIYTSGSSGRPKGVGLPHRGVVNHLRWCASQLPSEAVGGAPILSSYGFDLVVPALYTPLGIGQTVHVMPDGLDAAELADRLAAAAPYAFVKLTPGLLELLGEHLSPAQARRLASVLLVGGEAFSTRVLDTWRRLAPDTILVNHYGPTEVSVGCSSFRASDQPIATGLVPIGRPHRNQSSYLLDDRLVPVPIGVPGEIFAGGIGTARGYLNHPGMTAEKFLPDPFAPQPGRRMYRTGDLAYRLSSGDIVFLGRRDGQVKIRGYRVELGEIEQALAAHPDVRQAVVAAPTGEDGRQRLVAYVVGEALASATTVQLRSWLADRLPPYAVPATYVQLDRLPLTANGKVDRTALPEPESLGRAVERDYVAPRVEAERRLAEAWSQVLRVDRIGVHDNFFELGGDSIMTLQIVARARQSGVLISPKLIFAYPTVAQLAQQAAEITATAPVRRAAPTADWFPLSPTQRAFVERELPHHNHYNQSVAFDLADADPIRLAAALRAVVAQHHGLRSRFDLGPDGPRQRIAEQEHADLLWLREFAADDESGLAAEADRLQASLDIAQGPVIRAVLFRMGESRRLLIAVHHLVVDTLSWRPLIEDLATAYTGDSLPAASSSYQDWVRALPADDRQAEAFTGDTPLPADHDHGPDTVGAATSVHVRLSAEDTDRLLRQAPQAHRIQVEDIIVTAAAATLQAWAGGPVALDIERHGRDGSHEYLDLSRTIGWFTQVLPVHVARPDLHEVKERLRAAPGRRRQVSQVVVNYHGRVDQSIIDSGPFAVSATPLGSEKDPAYPRPRPIEIEAGVRNGVLQVEWIYPANRMREVTVHRLAEDFLGHVRKLTEYCIDHPGGYTPSDFPLARLTPEEVGRLTADGDVEDIHRLTPLQEGLLFHSILDPYDDLYLGRRTYQLTGRVDTEAFVAAWRQVARRHPILRSTIAWEGVSQPVQVVRARAELPVAGAVRRDGFDLTSAPPIEVALIPQADGLEVVFTYHHIILDGWSVSIVITEVMQVYHALLEGGPDPLPPAPPFRRFVEWIESTDTAADARYWRRTLGDLDRATPLPVTPQPATSGSATVDLALPANISDSVRRFGAASGLTLATLAHGAWALVLAGCSCRDDVVFGSTVSIRPSELRDATRIVGPLINTLPVRVRVEPGRRPHDWLTGLQGLCADVREHGASSLTDIHRQTSLPPEVPLFESILVVENFPQPVVAGPAASLTAVREFERTGYPVVVGVIDTNPIRVQVLYERAACSPESALLLAEGMLDALATMAQQTTGSERHQIPMLSPRLLAATLRAT